MASDSFDFMNVSMVRMASRLEMRRLHQIDRIADVTRSVEALNDSFTTRTSIESSNFEKQTEKTSDSERGTWTMRTPLDSSGASALHMGSPSPKAEPLANRLVNHGSFQPVASPDCESSSLTKASQKASH